MNNCIFCKIINKELPATIITESDEILVIKDIAPKAPIHYLIIPKKHFPDLQSADQDDVTILGKALLIAKEIAKTQKLNSFRLISNNGEESGQCVFHFHVHFLSGKQFGNF